MLHTQAQLDSPARHADLLLTPFACSWTKDGDDAACVSMTGELDLATSPQLERTLSEAQRHARLVVADLRRVAFADSSALHALVAANNRAYREGGRLVILRGPPAVDRIFALSRVCDVIEIVDLDAGEPPATAVLRLAEESDTGAGYADARLQRTG